MSDGTRSCANSIGLPSGLSPTNARHEFNDALARLPLDDVHDLMREAAEDAEYSWVEAIVQHLVRDRAERPDARHYEALLLANASPEHGCAHEVEVLIDDMHADGVQFTKSTYFAIIKV